MTSSRIDGQPLRAHVITLLPAYLNHTLDVGEHERVGAHLSICGACQAELWAWLAIAESTREAFAAPAIQPSPDLLSQVWGRIDQTPLDRLAQRLGPLHRRLAVGGRLALAQVWLIPAGIWVLSAAVLLLCFTGMLFWHIGTYPRSILGAFVPLTTAIGMAFIYGPEYDESLEVTLSTPVSPRAVLLSRAALVFAYNFALGLTLTLALVMVRGGDFSMLIAYWAGPTLLLAGLSLLLSLTISSLTGIACIGVLWLARVVGAAFDFPGTVFGSGSGPLTEIWKTSPITLLVALVLFACAVLYVPFQRRLKA